MTFADWLTETKDRYKTEPVSSATIESTKALYHGFMCRTVDPRVGKLWWHREWDILVILDACRVDLATETLPHDVDSVWSPAATSIDWIERHFADEYANQWQNTAYVTANPFADHDSDSARSTDLTEKNIGYLDLVYERGFQNVNGIKTTPPEAVTNAAIHAWRTQDVDRMIVHYMQPHQPFRAKPEWESVYSNLENLAGSVNQGGPDIWHRHKNGEFERDDLWNAYKDNLEWVWNDVKNTLLQNVSGDVVITADHGNGLGEYGVWSHPPNTIVPSVRKVPVIGPIETTDENTHTPSIVAGSDGETTVNSQLEALGYL